MTHSSGTRKIGPVIPALTLRALGILSVADGLVTLLSVVRDVEHLHTVLVVKLIVGVLVQGKLTDGIDEMEYFA